MDSLSQPGKKEVDTWGVLCQKKTPQNKLKGFSLCFGHKNLKGFSLCFVLGKLRDFLYVWDNKRDFLYVLVNKKLKGFSSCFDSKHEEEDSKHEENPFNFLLTKT